MLPDFITALFAKKKTNAQILREKFEEHEAACERNIAQCAKVHSSRLTPSPMFAAAMPLPVVIHTEDEVSNEVQSEALLGQKPGGDTRILQKPGGETKRGGPLPRTA